MLAVLTRPSPTLADFDVRSESGMITYRTNKISTKKHLPELWEPCFFCLLSNRELTTSSIMLSYKGRKGMVFVDTLPSWNFN